MYNMREESGKETLWSQTLKNWSRWTHQKLHAGRLNAKGSVDAMKGDFFIFPVADGTVKVSGGDQHLRTSTLIRDRSDDLSCPYTLQDDSTRDDAGS